ncbi:MAG: porphobilinogen synthase [Gammaproteobacteria bacterium WSBS_2016_MAG_OTU1]
MKYPRTRMRRLRSDEWLRRMVAESVLSPADLILPLFVHEEKQDSPIDSMPGISRLSLDGMYRVAEKAMSLQIPAVVIFPVIAQDKKSADSEEAWNANGLVPRAVGELKKRFPNLGVITDVALDPYSIHGQDGIVDENGQVLNDETIVALTKQALMQANAGVDIVAPSDMMDGRIGVLRDALETAGHQQVKILSYSAKYASGFYGPFRDAVGSAANLGSGDKRTYQMSPANRREALTELQLDLSEGADMLMIKPGLPYLDIVRDAACEFNVPILAYQVSGEYAMLKAAAEKGWIDGEVCMMESLLAFKRAGACAVLTYFAMQAAEVLAGEKNSF